jgi:hypothetical protein
VTFLQYHKNCFAKLAIASPKIAPNIHLTKLTSPFKCSKRDSIFNSNSFKSLFVAISALSCASRSASEIPSAQQLFNMINHTTKKTTTALPDAMVVNSH